MRSTEEEAIMRNIEKAKEKVVTDPYNVHVGDTARQLGRYDRHGQLRTQRRERDQIASAPTSGSKGILERMAENRNR
jgi:hypothetical protein